MSLRDISDDAMDSYIEVVDEDTVNDDTSPFKHTIPNSEMSSSWTVAATKLLIELRSTYNDKFQNARKKGQKMELWLLISNEMKEKNHNFCERQCDEKWRRLLTRFRQVRDVSKVSGSGNIKWQYYSSIENSISQTMRQPVSPPRDLLHESFARPLLEPSVSSIQESSLSVMEEPPTSGLVQKSLLNKTRNKTPSWIAKCEELKNEQLKSAKEKTKQLNNCLGKLEKKEEVMIKTQEELVKNLEDANNSPFNPTIPNSEMSSSWTVAATKLLIELRSTYNEKFQNTRKKGEKMELWLLISNEMKEKNHNFCERQCDEKWRRLLTRFRQVRDVSKVSRSGNIKWQYYDSMENSTSPTMRQTVSPPRDLLHESSAGPLLKPSVSSIQESSRSLMEEPSTSGLIQKSLLNKTRNKTPSWITKCEELKNEQLKSAKENAKQLNNRLGKLEKKEEVMLKTQEELVKNLEDANNSPFNHTILNSEMSSSWTVAATKLLIELRSTYNEKFQNTRKKGKKMELWLLISNEMKEKNHNFCERQCDEKWRRLLTRFRQVRDVSKVSRSGNIKWQYYDSMENSISPTMRQTVSPPRDLLHESSAGPLLKPSVSSIPESSEFSIQESSRSVMEEPPTSGLIQKSLLNKTRNKTPSWITKCEELKNEQLKAAKEIVQLNDRIDKLEKREEAMLKTQKELVKKLENANNIELQKLNVFKKMFNMD